jgi:hypothetical protein
MMLQELRVAEQRLRAVWEVLDGASVTEVIYGTTPVRLIVIGKPWGNLRRHCRQRCI